MAAVTQAPQPTRTRPPKRPPTQATANRRALWFLLLPSLVPVVLFSVYPLLNGIWLGFTDAQAGYQVDYHFNGFDNYVRLLKDDVFWSSFRIGLIWAFSVTILQFRHMGGALARELPGAGARATLPGEVCAMALGVVMDEASDVAVRGGTVIYQARVTGRIG